MAEFHFYCLKQDWRDLLNAILERSSLRFAFDEIYAEPSCPLYSSVDDAELQRLLSGKRRVFLFGDYSASPPHFRLQRNGRNSGKYFIDVTKGSEAMSLTLPACVEKGKITRIGVGSLYRPAEYWDANLTQATPASEGVKAAFRAVRKALRDELVSAKIVEPIWLSKLAQELVSERKATVMINGRWQPAVEA